MIIIDGRVYDGIADKPSIYDFIEHRDHKYISKHKGKNGKWIYVYANKVKELLNKQKEPETNIDYANWNNQRAMRGEGLYGRENHQTEMRRIARFTGRREDIKRARNNAKLKAQAKGNIRDRGYSSSQGSGESKRMRNLGTRKNIINTKYTTKINPNLNTVKDRNSLSAEYYRSYDAYQRKKKKK